jgi:hypothetical protein
MRACQVLAAVLWQSQKENPAAANRGRERRAGSREPSGVGGTKRYVTRAPLRKLTGAAKVPHGASCSLLTRHHALGRPVACRAACKEKAPLSAGLLSHTHFLHAVS